MITRTNEKNFVGDQGRTKDGRLFIDLNEEQVQEILKYIENNDCKLNNMARFFLYFPLY